jgi:hypothetical protein
VFFTWTHFLGRVFGCFCFLTGENSFCKQESLLGLESDIVR